MIPIYYVTVAQDLGLPAKFLDMTSSITQCPDATQLAYHDAFTAYRVAAMIGGAVYRDSKQAAQRARPLPLFNADSSDLATVKAQL